MTLRDFSQLKYVPTLSLRPAEMIALEELPEKDKDAILPFILLRPWTTAHHLKSAIDRIEKSYTDRPLILDFDREFEKTGDRPVFKEIEDLKISTNGYQNWGNFIYENKNVIPAIQLLDIEEIEKQIGYIKSLERGLAIRFTEANMSESSYFIERFKHALQGTDVIIIFDFGQQNRDILSNIDLAQTFITNICTSLTSVHFVAAASSFPLSFTDLNSQKIYERTFFIELRKHLPSDIHLIYGDHGSARAQKITGGGGQPAPRIDYPLDDEWIFYRENDPINSIEDKNTAYQNLAKQLMGNKVWQKDLRLWGTQMIERTANGSENSINSPVKASSVRINQHLHRQLALETPSIDVMDTDDDWEDD